VTGPAKERGPLPALRFDRNELAGSLGDIGTLLPLAIGLILVNGLDATGLLISVGLFYVLAGLYFGVTVPVQPMKVIGAYAIASALPPGEITAAALWMAALLLVLGVTGTLTLVCRLVPFATVRGVQLATGVLLLTQGLEFFLGGTTLQTTHDSAEPFLQVDALGTMPMSLLLGLAAVALILALRGNRRVPAALAVVALGLLAGLLLGGWQMLGELELALHRPQLLPFGWPSGADIAVALTALALPQLPMTIGNAVVAQADLTREYFGDEAARRASPRALAVSMGLANAGAAAVGGMPLCHGAGGLAAHYRFGARTAGSNLMIGGLFVALAVLVGHTAPRLLMLLPFGVLGALLAFAGIELALMIRDVREREDLLVAIAMLGVTLATNLGAGFLVGIALSYLLGGAPTGGGRDPGLATRNGPGTGEPNRES
jgi:SulP family sulfate permease